MTILSSGLIDQTDTLFVQLLGEMRQFMGRDVRIVNYSEINCPNCLYSYIDGASAGIYDPDDPYPSGIPGPIPFSGICPLCKGSGKYITKNQENVKVLINWASPRDRAAMAAGYVEPWDVTVQASVGDADRLKTANEVYVDDTRVNYQSMQKGGLKTIAGVTMRFRKIGDEDES